MAEAEAPGEGRTRGPKPGLSTARIVEAAIAVADAEGLAAVSMQRVAQAFGFTTMSLYRYLPGKADLVGLMFDAAMGSPPDLSIHAGWRAQLRAWAHALSALLHRRPWGLEVLNQLHLMGPNELGWLEAALAAFTGTGLEGEAALDAIFALTGHVRISAQYTVRQPESAGAVAPEAWTNAILTTVREQPDAYPALNVAIAAGAFQNNDAEQLAVGVELILDGVAQQMSGVRRS